MQKIFIIAEVGPNHNGSLNLAKKLINKICKTGADAVKFQLGNPDKVYSQEAFKADYQKKNDRSKNIKDMSNKIQLSKRDHLELSKYCKKKGITYLCSAFDIDSLKYLVEKLKIPIVKIPSGEILTIDMLKYISKFKGKIILSTGMSTLNDIKISLGILKSKNVTLLHCVSLYPTPLDKVNLNNINLLKKKFNLNVGFSDHTKGALASLTAAGMGITVLEKHVTLSNKLEGPDHKSSIDVKNFNNFVKNIRNVDLMLGEKYKTLNVSEKKNSLIVKKSIYASKPIKKGEYFNKDNIALKRPMLGLPADMWFKILGKRAKKSYLSDEIIEE